MVEILNKLLGTRMMLAQQPPIHSFIYSFILALHTYTLFDWFQEETGSFCLMKEMECGGWMAGWLWLGCCGWVAGSGWLASELASYGGSGNKANSKSSSRKQGMWEEEEEEEEG